MKGSEEQRVSTRLRARVAGRGPTLCVTCRAEDGKSVLKSKSSENETQETDCDVVRPLCGPKHPLLEPSRGVAEQPLRGVRQHAEHDLVVLLERLGQIGVDRVVRLSSWVVQVLVRSTRAGVQLDGRLGTGRDAGDLGVEAAAVGWRWKTYQ